MPGGISFGPPPLPPPGPSVAAASRFASPGVFLEGPDFYSPDELDYRFEVTDEKAVINVGSVGQPRDRDPRASFVVVHETHIEFVRIDYDIDTTVKKVADNPSLDNFLGTRLIDGR